MPRNNGGDKLSMKKITCKTVVLTSIFMVVILSLVAPVAVQAQPIQKAVLKGNADYAMLVDPCFEAYGETKGRVYVYARMPDTARVYAFVYIPDFKAWVTVKLVSVDQMGGDAGGFGIRGHWNVYCNGRAFMRRVVGSFYTTNWVDWMIWISKSDEWPTEEPVTYIEGIVKCHRTW
jgi:hypothetical protein